MSEWMNGCIIQGKIPQQSRQYITHLFNEQYKVIIKFWCPCQNMQFRSDVHKCLLSRKNLISLPSSHSVSIKTVITILCAAIQFNGTYSQLTVHGIVACNNKRQEISWGDLIVLCTLIIFLSKIPRTWTFLCVGFNWFPPQVSVINYIRSFGLEFLAMIGYSLFMLPHTLCL